MNWNIIFCFNVWIGCPTELNHSSVQLRGHNLMYGTDGGYVSETLFLKNWI